MLHAPRRHAELEFRPALGSTALPVMHLQLGINIVWLFVDRSKARHRGFEVPEVSDLTESEPTSTGRLAPQQAISLSGHRMQIPKLALKHFVWLRSAGQHTRTSESEAGRASQALPRSAKVFCR